MGSIKLSYSHYIQSFYMISVQLPVIRGLAARIADPPAPVGFPARSGSWGNFPTARAIRFEPNTFSPELCTTVRSVQNEACRTIAIILAPARKTLADDPMVFRAKRVFGEVDGGAG